MSRGETAAKNREKKVLCGFSACSATPRESAVSMDPSWFTRSRGIAENQRAQVYCRVATTCLGENRRRLVIRGRMSPYHSD